MREQTLLTRRALLQGAMGATAIAAAGQMGIAREEAFAQDGDSEKPAHETAQYGFLVKVDNCIDCGECVKACRLWSRTPKSAEARRKVTAYKNDIGKEYFVTTSCMHCAEPSCAAICPAGAISKGEGGIVSVDQDRCIGCKYCFQACPFAVPHYTSRGMDKCDYCLGNDVALGEKPRCVKACKVGALHYGKVEDFVADTKGKAQQIEASTGPSYYLV